MHFFSFDPLTPTVSKYCEWLINITLYPFLKRKFASNVSKIGKYLKRGY